MCGGPEIVEDISGHGHHDDATWEQWRRKRTFVRALEGTYGELVHDLFSQPRVYHSRDRKWTGGPGMFNKDVINPHLVKVTQSIESHIEDYAPASVSQKHGHMNSAVLYVLKGKGHDVHEGRRFDWEAGDAMIVENACVHQHFNDSPTDEAIILVMKAKPLFLFMDLIFQKIVQYPPDRPVPGQEHFAPPTEI